jgi:hypothetical protein
MNFFQHWTWFSIEKISIIASLLAAIFSFAAWFRLRQNHKRLQEIAKNVPEFTSFKQTVEYYSEINTECPHVLSMSLTHNTNSIRGDVERFLKVKDWFCKVKYEYEINMFGINNLEDLERFVNELRRTRALLQEKNATELLLFIQGPVAAGVIVGSMFDNWIPVKIFHHPSPSPPDGYNYWMPIMKT